MSMKLVHATSMSAALLLLCGCVGFMVYTPAPEESIKPPFNTNTKKEVIRWYGEPSEVTMLGNVERWRIKSINVSGWCGALIAVGVGIPLMLPACESYSEWDFENDRVIAARFRESKGNGLLCGAVGRDFEFTCKTKDP